MGLHSEVFESNDNAQCAGLHANQDRLSSCRITDMIIRKNPDNQKRYIYYNGLLQYLEQL
jgi:hypothetical protein